MNVVWIKRDARLHDHTPLAEAAQQSSRVPALVLFVYEPEHVTSKVFDGSHLQFINEGLAEMDSRLRGVSGGGGLTYRTGDVVEVLSALHATVPIQALLSHEETGNGISLARNRRVATWAQEAGVAWREYPQSGVVRGLTTRDGWAKRWDAFMRQPVAPQVGRIRLVDQALVPSQGPRSAEDLGIAPSTRSEAQSGGEGRALDALDAFLRARGSAYQTGLSSPVTAWTACSRLSPYLAWGHLSLRHTVQQLRRRQEELRALKKEGADVGNWPRSMAAYQSRLRWRSHFMQKLEDEPRIEHEAMCRAYDGLRAEPEAGSEEAQRAWEQGRTGFPLVDACMRALHSAGWINFRMRAMLVSFACHNLWLDWRRIAPWLARHFLDYEPGIHYSQLQMQAGTTGINAVRIYSPEKQVQDHDPKGAFIRKYVPELAAVPDKYMAGPHRMPKTLQQRVGCVIGRDYPAPIVDATATARVARERIAVVRRSQQGQEEAVKVYVKHGSRKRTRSIGPGLQRVRDAGATSRKITDMFRPAQRPGS